MKTKGKYQTEITSVVFDKQRSKEIFKRILDVLIAEKIEKVDVTFGFAWGNEIYENEWLPISASPLNIETMVETEYQKGTGEIGSDDFYIDISDKNIRIQSCHENDIHIEYNHESDLVHKIKATILPTEWAWKKEAGKEKWEKITS